jgi:2-polyprenyl-6-methoxyphenol hydroxylase-like FAD-dependent oxidoreductase
VLAALGLRGRLREAGTPCRGAVFRNHRGRTIGTIAGRDDEIALNLGRAHVMRILRDEAVRSGIEIRYEHRLRELIVDGPQVTAVFDHGARELGELVVGTDGVHSRVRAWLSRADAAPRDTRMISLGGFCDGAPGGPLDARASDYLTFMIGPQHQFGYGRFGGDRWAWWCHVHAPTAGERSALLEQPFDDLRTAMLERYRGWADPVERLIRATQAWVRTPIYDLPRVAIWQRGPVVVVGDAAHAMSPAGGQGASLALEDAAVLAQLIGRGSAPFAPALARFEALRRPRVEPMVAQAYANDRRTLHEAGPVGLWLRDRVMLPVFARVISRALRRVHAFDATRIGSLA